jgi:hypothetical protein
MNLLRFSAITCVLSFFLHFSANAQSIGDYQSAASGPWSTVATWQIYNGSAWVAATAAPSSTDGVITIQSPHTVQITAMVSLDQVVINSGATINWTNSTCTFVNGAGVDLLINGTFWDNRGVAGTSITFTASTWQMGANGTLIRSAGNSSNNWQSSYEGGISNIPATSNWILRKTTGQIPVLSSTTPASGSVYPNLTIENNTGNAFNVGFIGSAATPTVKGNLDIGGAGSGAGAITFTNSNTFGSPTLVQGNLRVRTGKTYQNYGTGTEIRGNLIVNGTFSYDANDGRNLVFSGGNAQAINGAGALSIYNITFNKSAGGVTLNRAIIVDNLSTFTNGIVTSTLTNLYTLNTSATVSGANDLSFVNGPVRRIGSTGITFPVGKGANYRMCEIGNGAGGSPTYLYTENFNTGAGWTLNDVTGAEGADANYFVIGDGEGGCLSTITGSPSGIVPNLGAGGSCGVASNGNNTLHVTSVFNPAGGAAYDAGGLCGFLFCPQANRRCISPSISTVGQTGLTLLFDYIEGGESINDNAQVWFSTDNGASWALLEDMPKSLTGCGGQGLWTTRSLILPASCDNISTLKIAFSWVNNDDGVGTDPSFALDNVIVAKVPPIASFTAEYFPSNPQIPYGNTLAPTLENLSDCEYWIIDRDAGTEARTVTLSWNASSCAITALPDLKVARHDGISTWQDEGNGGTTGSVTAGTISSGAPVVNFSPFTIANVTITPLPVELIAFDLFCENNSVQFSWSTNSEHNNSHFVIEGSQNGQNWYEIGIVNGVGNSSELNKYWFETRVEFDYYRLVQVDYDGARKEYPAKMVTCNDDKLAVFPNPANDLITIKSDEPISSLAIFNAFGKMVKEVFFTEEMRQVEVDLSDQATGIYFLSVSTKAGEEVVKLVVE